VSKIVGALLVRNEAAPDRYLRRVLANVASFCDATVVLDDGSDDDTVDVCRAAGALVTTQGIKGGWWEGGAEMTARAKLWALAAEEAGEAGWIYVADADHELLGLRPEELRAMTRATTVNCWAFVLWDAWDSDETHRVDGFWQAWHTPRPWFFKAQPYSGFAPEWGARGIHAGHAPLNYPAIAGLAPQGAGIRHLGYVSLRHRKLKRSKYLQLA